MVSSLFAAGSAPPAVRKPVIELSFGSGSAEDWKNTVETLTLEAGLGPSVDRVEARLAAVQQAPVPAIGDAGSVSLGYSDAAAETVFTGQVEAVGRSIHGATHVVASNGGALLSRLRINQSYEQQKAGDIVQDLAGRAGVSAGSVEAGVTFPFYVVDDRRTAYQHIAALARKCGFSAYFTPEGELTFAPITPGQPVQSFTYGVDILALQVYEAAPGLGQVTVVGEGAAGSQGQDAWSWLVQDPGPVTGTGGQGAPQRLVRDPSLRSQDAAQKAAEGIASASKLLDITGVLLVPGAPRVVVGGTIEIADAPVEALNGQALVRRVRHRFSKREGFTTLVAFSKTGSGAGGLGGLL